MCIYLAVARFKFLLQPVCSRAETLYLFGHLGPGEELGAGEGVCVAGGGVKVEEIDKLRGEWGDRHQVPAGGNRKTKVHLLTLPGWRES